MLVWYSGFQFIKVHILFVVSGLVANQENIARQIILNTSNATNQITKIHICHLRTSAVIACDKQIISRQINTLNQRACAEHRSDFFIFKEFFYSHTDS